MRGWPNDIFVGCSLEKSRNIFKALFARGFFFGFSADRLYVFEWRYLDFTPFATGVRCWDQRHLDT